MQRAVLKGLSELRRSMCTEMEKLERLLDNCCLHGQDIPGGIGDQQLGELRPCARGSSDA